MEETTFAKTLRSEEADSVRGPAQRLVWRYTEIKGDSGIR